ncbi:hypothetical protein LWI28_024883 [Acer negundo]|uniref:Uncharacterized protein n=1 Tax=Acer negundo TaxID=4023 RepID=A0AAD5NWL3_ACENE|nr:hypothetical protein LWI28_024883 [Acer negundo]
MHVDLVAINTIQEKPTLLIQIDQQQQLYKAFDIQQMGNQPTVDIGPWGEMEQMFRLRMAVKEIKVQRLSSNQRNM